MTPTPTAAPHTAPAAASTTAPPLSCYTTNLLAVLTLETPDTPTRFTDAVRLAVRTDLGPGEAAFSHHHRVDITSDGSELAYRGADRWADASSALAAAVHNRGPVLAVANTATLPWSPAFGRAVSPHWVILLAEDNDNWLVADHFEALTPFGEQHPVRCRLTGAQLASALLLPAELPAELTRRDRMALGEQVTEPPTGRYRWLTRTTPTGPLPPRPGHTPGPGQWTHGAAEVIRHMADIFRSHPESVARYTDDLWAAGRHQTYRISRLTGAGVLDPQAAGRLSATWAELPRVLRFASASAERGRPRPGIVDRAMDQLTDAYSHTAVPYTEWEG
ncbi:hypothetical protein V1L54_27155 [Streptomyces sp. TRM 70361]|uniref:hypothetical protein n=1 Tax=Streptomyces sp. TRM 70361 TaxID=3116553 RepID=UPI002E7AE04B|nr:hypothetical protein [Streptomyces sp. TRM 70361]MEE1943039.1 hypothetical protein [Streptomyces sp. TRM 70361]